jgi:hypothetical protein
VVGVTALEVIRDAAMRAARILEACADGEHDIAAFMAEDLERDLRNWLATQQAAA